MNKLIFITGICICFQSGFCQTATDYFEKGKDKANLGSYYAAIKDFDKAIEMDPLFLKAYVTRAAAKESTGDFQGAIDDYTKATELSPDYALAYYNRGLVKITIRQNDGACADFRKAAELGYAKAEKAVEVNCK